MIRWIFKWMFRAVIIVVVLVVIFLLSLNSILRMVVEHNIRKQTGMDAEIGRFKLGWTEPAVEIQDLRIYNPPGFAGTPFLDIAEIHAEFDRTALLKKELHLTLLRFRLAELDIVKGENGQTNIFALPAPSQKKSGAATPSFKKQTGYDFTGIDALNVSFGRVKYIDLKDPRNNREQTIGIQDWVIPKVKSANDLAGLVVFIDLRSNHFFDSLLARQRNPAALQSIINIFGVAL